MRKQKLIFWSRIVGWLGIGCGVPIGTFAAKFGLFKVTVEQDALGNPVTNGNISLNGWGIVSCLLLGTYAIQILKEVSEASPEKYTMVKQCLQGLSKTLPYIIAYFALYFLSGVIETMMFCLAVLIICRLIATPINPLPAWKFEKQGVVDYNDVADLLTDIVKRFRKEAPK